VVGAPIPNAPCGGPEFLKARSGAEPARQPNQSTATVISERMTTKLIRELHVSGWEIRKRPDAPSAGFTFEPPKGPNKT